MPVLDKPGAFAHFILWIFIGFSTVACSVPNRSSRMARGLAWRRKALGVFGKRVSDVPICHGPAIFFFSRARQVYNYDLYTTLIVVVNGSSFLWTTRLKSEKSGIYVTDKSVHCWANLLVANLDKIFACAKKPSFTQTIPVDIK